jgi:hypothetical protein
MCVNLALALRTCSLLGINIAHSSLLSLSAWCTNTYGFELLCFLWVHLNLCTLCNFEYIFVGVFGISIVHCALSVLHACSLTFVLNTWFSEFGINVSMLIKFNKSKEIISKIFLIFYVWELESWCLVSYYVWFFCLSFYFQWLKNFNNFILGKLSI